MNTLNCQYTHGVSEKFKYFVIFLHQSCITNQCCDAANILQKIYDKNSIICELIAYALDITVYVELHKK